MGERDEGKLSSRRTMLRSGTVGIAALSGAAGMGVAGASPAAPGTDGLTGPYAATVFMRPGTDATETVAISRDGAVIRSAATSADGNQEVINAAIESVAEAGGGAVFLTAGVYELGAELVLRQGVDLVGEAGIVTRAPELDTGAVLAPQAGVAATIRVGEDGAEATNPHGSSITTLAINGNATRNAFGIDIHDTHDVRILRCTIVNFLGDTPGAGTWDPLGWKDTEDANAAPPVSTAAGVRVYSTLSPNHGGFANNVTECVIYNCQTGLQTGGTQGATDGMLSGCRILASLDYSLDFRKAGGWQIWDNHITSGVVRFTHANAMSSTQFYRDNYFDSGRVFLAVVTETATTWSGNRFLATPRNEPAPRSQALVKVLNPKISMIGNSFEPSRLKPDQAWIELPGNPPAHGVFMGNTGVVGEASLQTGPIIDQATTPVPDTDTPTVYIGGNKAWVRG
jgi:hypothetical protein